MSVAIIILNYRTPGMTLDCMRSLARQVEAIPGARAIIVDNGSGDGSAEAIQSEIDAQGWRWAQLLALPANIGFAAGNNRGLWLVGDAKYVLLLNSDTLVHEGCLAHCIKFMEEDLTIGLMSCRLVGRDGGTQPVARRFTSPLQQLVCAFALPWRMPRWFGWADPEKAATPSKVCDTDWVPGAFMFCRADLLKRLGGMDESFFFYGEDYELCHRVHKAGYRVRYDPRASITHLGGGSSDASRLADVQKSRLIWRGRYLVYRKCNGRFASGMVRMLDLIHYGGRALVYRALHGRRADRYRNSAQVFQLLAGRL